MDISIATPADDSAVIHLKGKFTIEQVDIFKEKITPVIREGMKSIFVDFSHVEFVDSSGMGILMLFMNSAKNLNINVILYNLNKDVMSLFKIAYLDKFFIISTSSKLKTIYPGIPF
jgi:anti-sigma B factor antagonist